MPQIYNFIFLVVSSLATFFVYKHAEKEQLPYRNVWIVATFLLPPVAFFYYVYAKVYKHKVVLTKKQKVTIAQNKKLKERQLELEKERQVLKQKQAEQKPEMLEAAEKQRQKQKAELTEKRRWQEELEAKRLKLK